MIGALNLASYEPHAFDAEHIHIAREMADQRDQVWEKSGLNWEKSGLNWEKGG